MINKTTFKKLLSLMTLSAFTLLSLTGCAKNTSTSAIKNENSTVITLNAYGELDPQVSAQQIIADKMGFFKEEGLNVTNHLMTGPDQNASLVANGTAEVCFGSVYNNIAVAANNINVKVLAPLANAGGTQSVVARPGLTINSAKDLEGKKIGMTSGAGVLIAIRNMCEDLDVDINKITFVNLQASDQLASLEKGDIDAMACWEPWVGKALDIGGTLLFSGATSNLPEKTGDVNWIDFYMTVQVSQKLLNDHPEAAEKLISALLKATEFINNNPKEAAEIIAKEINIDADECLRIMEKNVYSMEFNEEFVSAADTMAEFMLEMNNISKAPDFNSYGYSDILKKVNSSLVTVK